MNYDYCMFIDESGDHLYGKQLEKYLRLNIGDRIIEIPDIEYPMLENINSRYLAILGVIISNDSYLKMSEQLESIKNKYFGEYKKDTQIIFHREEIVRKTGPFIKLKNPMFERAFSEEILRFYGGNEYTLILVVIDKLEHINRYGDYAFHPYHYSVELLLERYCGYLDHISKTGMIVAESRGKDSDKLLKQAFKRFRREGNRYHPAEQIQKTISNKIITKLKSDNIAGLQVADLLVNPLKRAMLIEKRNTNLSLSEFNIKLCNHVETKFNCHLYNNRVWGYGKVFK